MVIILYSAQYYCFSQRTDGEKSEENAQELQNSLLKFVFIYLF